MVRNHLTYAFLLTKDERGHVRSGPALAGHLGSWGKGTGTYKFVSRTNSKIIAFFKSCTSGRRMSGG